MPVDVAKEAVRAAMLAEGLRDLRITAGTQPGHLFRATCVQPGWALAPFGAALVVDCFVETGAEGEEGTCVYCVSGTTTARTTELLQKIQQQVDIRVAELRDPGRMAVSDAPESPVPVTAHGPATPLPPFSDQRHAIIIGITEYRDNSLSSLPKARRDVEALARFLSSPEGGNIAASRIHLLVDEKASRAAIIQTLIDVGSTTKPGDLILLYFAGHGIAPSADKKRSRFLMAYDSRPREPEASGIDRDLLCKYLDEAQARRQAVFLDCCFAGSDDVVERGAGIEPDPFLGMTSDGECARVIITASKGSETAIEVRDDEHSPFAAALLEACSGRVPEVDRDKDERLSAGELYDYLYLHVAREARRVGKEAHPQIYGPRDVPVMNFTDR